MQTWSYWKQFENTGRIADYLSYREECGGTEETADGAVGRREAVTGRQERTGNDAGVYTCDRNDFETGPYGGVR